MPAFGVPGAAGAVLGAILMSESKELEVTGERLLMFAIVTVLVCGLAVFGCKKKQAEPEKPAAP